MPNVVWFLNNSHVFDFCYYFHLVIAIEYEEELLNIFYHLQKMEVLNANDSDLQEISTS